MSEQDSTPRQLTAEAVVNVAARAAAKFGDYTSTHEALGVLLEEFDELKDAIRDNDAAAIREESLDVASVALRLAEQAARRAPSFLVRSGCK